MGDRIEPVTLSHDERDRVFDVFKCYGHEVRILLFGEGERRVLKFYADGTRMEATVAYPEVTDGKPKEGEGKIKRSEKGAPKD